MSKSYVNGIVLDKEDDFVNVPVQLSGLKDILQGIKDLICTLSGIPHNILFGESPGASLGEGGISQARAWYDTVKQYQNNEISEPFDRLLRIICLSMGINEEIEWHFCSLYQQPEKEKAECELLEAQADKTEAETYQIFITSGIYTVDEVKAKLEEDEQEYE